MGEGQSKCVAPNDALPPPDSSTAKEPTKRRKRVRKHKPHIPTRLHKTSPASGTPSPSGVASSSAGKAARGTRTYSKEWAEKLHHSTLTRRENVLNLSRASDSEGTPTSVSSLDRRKQLQHTAASLDIRKSLNVVPQSIKRFEESSLRITSSTPPTTSTDKSGQTPTLRKSRRTQSVRNVSRPSKGSGAYLTPSKSSSTDNPPVPAGAYLAPGVTENSETLEEDEESDSIDWDALDQSSTDEYTEDDLPTPRPTDYSAIVQFLTSLNHQTMHEIGVRMSERCPDFLSTLRDVVEDYQDEKRALGEDSEDSSEDVLGQSTSVAPNGSQATPGGYDWNRQFQSIISQLKEHGDIMENRVRCYRTLSNLALDFIHCAKTYGRLIISEAGTPIDSKTIPPTKIGGFAGGDKYIVNNILFKFAVDSQNLFDSEEAAHKIAGHDLKGLISYFNLGIADLYFPLMALVDYLGYRLIAISVLPITKDTIVYGSADAGQHIYNDCPDLERKMACAATLLNLKPHQVGLEPEHQVNLYSAGDLEGHQVDDEFYLLDFSRAFPPCTYDRSKRNSYLFRLLRPEFVKNYKEPLCSDAYSGFVTVNCQEHIDQVEEATRVLLRQEVPRVAGKLDALTEKQKRRLDVKEFLHENGINLRYMGLVRHHVKCAEIKGRLFIYMVARVVKHQIRSKMREQMKKWKLPLEHTCRHQVISYLNLVFGSSEESDEHFDDVIASRLGESFVGALQPEEQKCPLKKMFGPQDLCALFSYVQDMTALHFSSTALKEFSTDSSIYQYPTPFHLTELLEIGVRVRHLNIVALAQGYVLKNNARSKSSAENTTRLCELAITKFKQALQDNPGDKRALSELADTCAILGDNNSAREYYLRAIAADPVDVNTLFRYAVFLEDKMQLMPDAEEFYLRTLEINPRHDHCMQRYGHFLEHQGDPDEAEKFFIRASEVRGARLMGSSVQGDYTPANIVTEDFIF